MPTCHNAQIYNTRSLGAPRLLLYYEVGMSLLKPICLPLWFARGVRPEGKYKFELKEQITTFYQNFMIFSRKYFFPGSTVFKFATEQLSKIGGWATQDCWAISKFNFEFLTPLNFVSSICDAVHFCVQLDIFDLHASTYQRNQFKCNSYSQDCWYTFVTLHKLFTQSQACTVLRWCKLITKEEIIDSWFSSYEMKR